MKAQKPKLKGEANYRAFADFVTARHSVWIKRFKLSQPKPWTNDLILRQYRFCNVYRELDTVTQWIGQYIRRSYSLYPDLWFMLCIARQINWPDTLHDLIANAKAWPHADRWDPEAAMNVMRQRKENGLKVYTGAYMITGTGGEGRDKTWITTHKILAPLWKARKELRPQPGDTLSSWHAKLCSFHGWGSFLAAQVVADLKYAEKSPLAKAKDWWTWAAPGPGSKRGLNRVLGYPVRNAWPNDEIWLEEVNKLREYMKRVETLKFYERFHAQDIQNCLCEFSKYEAVRLGEGRMRARYPGGE